MLWHGTSLPITVRSYKQVRGKPLRFVPCMTLSNPVYLCGERCLAVAPTYSNKAPVSSLFVISSHYNHANLIWKASQLQHNLSSAPLKSSMGTLNQITSVYVYSPKTAVVLEGSRRLLATASPHTICNIRKRTLTFPAGLLENKLPR